MSKGNSGKGEGMREARLDFASAHTREKGTAYFARKRARMLCLFLLSSVVVKLCPTHEH